MKIFNPYALCMAMLCATTQAYAGGYSIPEQGSKATGMGGAFTAVADDPSASWYNPAGIAFQQDGLMVNADAIAPVFQYQDATGTKYTAKKQVFVVPQVYVNHQLGNSGLTLGLAVNAPFGLSTDWSNSSAPFSRLSAGSRSITFSQIEGVHINPNLAYRINEHMALSAGLTYVNLNKVHLNSQALNIGGHGDGFGGNASLMYRNDGFSLGLSYRSKVKVQVQGTAVGGAALALFGLQGIASNVTTSLTLPEMLSVGAAYRMGKLVVSVEADRVNWSSFNRIDLNFAASALNLVTGTHQSIPEHWKDVTAYRVGMDWNFSKQQSLRLGYANDPTPSHATYVTPRLPGADRQLVSLGYGSAISNHIKLDVAYSYIWLKQRNINQPATALYQGVYTSHTHLWSAGLVYQF